MRLTALALLAATAASLAATAAEAQSRKPLRIVVTPRSYLDPGVVAPVGSLQQYATYNLYSPAPASPSPQFIFSEQALPPRIGGGRNPFGPIDWSGSLGR